MPGSQGNPDSRALIDRDRFTGTASTPAYTFNPFWGGTMSVTGSNMQTCSGNKAADSLSPSFVLMILGNIHRHAFAKHA